VLDFLRHRADHETAQDVLAETFLTAWRKLDEVPADALPWLYGVARRLLANRRRSRARGQALVDRLAAEGQRAGRTGTDVELDGVEARHDVLRALAGLPARGREVLLLAGWYELTSAQAARVLGCTSAMFAVRLHRARRRLRGALAASTVHACRPAPSRTTPRTARGSGPAPEVTR
jgi:RNA polymerase sigma-70 factor, ECF subfamily